MQENEDRKDQDKKKKDEFSGFAFEEGVTSSLGFDPNRASKIENAQEYRKNDRN